MGAARRPNLQGLATNYISRRAAPDAPTRNVVRGDVGYRLPSGPRQKHPIPAIGDRVGKLTVTGYCVGKRGTLLQDRSILVCCDCGSPEYGATQNNLRSGKTTCCMVCGWRNAVATRKAYVGYRDVIADDTLRDVALQRINGIWRRCYSPKHGSYHAYGKRGIKCWWYEQYGIGAVKKVDKAIWRRKMLGYLVTLENWDKPGVELDRIDNDKGYEPGNLRFVGRGENASNRRTVWQLQQRILELEAENAELRACLRSSKQRAKK